jgi:hypothetical protein
VQRRFPRRRAWAPLSNAEREALAPHLPRAAGAVADNRPLRVRRVRHLDAMLRNTLAVSAPGAICPNSTPSPTLARAWPSDAEREALAGTRRAPPAVACATPAPPRRPSARAICPNSTASATRTGTAIVRTARQADARRHRDSSEQRGKPDARRHRDSSEQRGKPDTHRDGAARCRAGSAGSLPSPAAPAPARPKGLGARRQDRPADNAAHDGFVRSRLPAAPRRGAIPAAARAIQREPADARTARPPRPAPRRR